jgi:DNA-binding transcriptional regulator YdaS (Cro superfamily)
MISSNVLAYGLGLFAHMTSQMPARRHEQSTAIQAAVQRDIGGSVSPNATPGDLEWYHWLACSRVR